MMRNSGRGHSAAIHSKNEATIMAFAAAVPALRVAVNTGCSLGASGFETNLGPSMTIGTGFAGGSSIGDNLTPHHFVHYARIAYNKEASEAFGRFEGLDPLNLPKRAADPMSLAVDNTGDSVIEIAGEGAWDTITASVAYTIAANIEAIHAANGAALTGDTGGNVFYSQIDTAANVLSGGTGDDIYFLGAGDSVVEAAAGGGYDIVPMAPA